MDSPWKIRASERITSCHTYICWTYMCMFRDTRYIESDTKSRHTLQCLNSCLWAPTLKLAQHQLALCWHQWSASALQLGGYLDLQVAERWVGAWRVSRIKTFWSRRRTHAGESEQGGKRILSFAGSRIPKDLGDPSTQEFPQNRVAPLENFPLESPRSHWHFSIMAVLMLQTAQD